MTPSEAEFSNHPSRSDRPLVSLPNRGLAAALGLLSLGLVLFAVTANVERAPVLPTAQPLSGPWSCSLAGEPVGPLVIDGLTYVLGPAASGETGTIAIIGKHTKTSEEFLKVQSGPLLDQFGVRLGFHNRAVVPHTLVLNVGPGSGIQCIPG